MHLFNGAVRGIYWQDLTKEPLLYNYPVVLNLICQGKDDDKWVCFKSKNKIEFFA